VDADIATLTAAVNSSQTAKWCRGGWWALTPLSHFRARRGGLGSPSTREWTRLCICHTHTHTHTPILGGPTAAALPPFKSFFEGRAPHECGGGGGGQVLGGRVFPPGVCQCGRRAFRRVWAQNMFS
jgi:hypothetical protein